MKARPSILAFIALAPLLPSAAAADIKAEFVKADAAEAAEIRSLGDRAITRLAYSLVTEASQAVAKHGESQALATCHLKTVSTTGSVIPDMPRITAWKRTSLKVRDPANRPDAADLLALNHVQAELAAGNAPPKLLVQRVEPAGGPIEWRVYKPVGVLKQCLGCHGPTDSIPAAVSAELARRYPDDQATGYAQGEWRGLLRVSIGPPPPVATAAKTPGAKKR